MRKFKVGVWLAGTVACLTVGVIAAKTDVQPDKLETADHPINIRFQNLKWEKVVPELGEKSAEITILRVEPETKATHLWVDGPPKPPDFLGGREE